MVLISSLINSVDSLQNVTVNCYNGIGCYNKNLTRHAIESWKHSISKKLLNRYYHNLNLTKLKMIIIGSSGVQRRFCKFNEALAMVREEGSFGFVPSSVQNLITNLHYAFNSNGQLLVPKYQFNTHGFDLQCFQLIDEVLFINVCLSKYNSKMTKAVCSVRFINEILKAAKVLGNKVAVLDFRLSMHSHFSNSSSFRDSSWQFAYFQHDVNFKIVNPSNFHHYYRFCHPGYIQAVHCDKRISEAYVSMFRDIDRKGYPIKQWYKPIDCYWFIN